MAVCPRSREEQGWGCWDYCSSRVCRGSLKGGLAHSTWLHVLLRRVSLVWTTLSLPISLEGNLLEDCFSFQVTSCFHPPPPPSPCHLVLPPLQTPDEGFLKLRSKPEKAQWVHIFISFIGGQPRSDHMENIAGRSGKLWDSFLLGPFNIFFGNLPLQVPACSHCMLTATQYVGFLRALPSEMLGPQPDACVTPQVGTFFQETGRHASPPAPSGPSPVLRKGLTKISGSSASEHTPKISNCPFNFF